MANDCETCNWHGPHEGTFSAEAFRLSLEIHRTMHRIGVDWPVVNQDEVRADLAQLTLTNFVMLGLRKGK